MNWDVNFWSERMKEDLYAINDEKLRPYFALPTVLEGLFGVRRARAACAGPPSRCQISLFDGRVLRPPGRVHAEPHPSCAVQLAKRLFDVDIEAADGEVAVWDESVRFFRVKKGGEAKAHFYLDPYSRPAEKRGGAWMDEVAGQSKLVRARRKPPARALHVLRPCPGVKSART